ncbi:MAG: hypothetical protein ABI905_14415 [Betaproteobacteria bacterium]
MWKSIVLCAVLVCSAIGAGVGAGAAHAATFESRNFDALAVEAEQVVIGTASAATSRRTGEREIVTDYRFDNLDVVKGSVPSATLTLTLLGGTVGAETQSVAGAPKFIPGVRYLVFVAGNGTVMFPLVGGPQGIFQIRKDSASGVSRVHDYSGRPLTQLPGASAGDGLVNSRTETADPITQDTFVAAIRNKLAQGAK